MPTAYPIQNALSVIAFHPTYGIVETHCADYDAYETLPKAITFDGLTLGLTGWNSDVCRAYYKTGQKFAVAL